jgi:hypothetical protein
VLKIIRSKEMGKTATVAESKPKQYNLNNTRHGTNRTFRNKDGTCERKINGHEAHRKNSDLYSHK